VGDTRLRLVVPELVPVSCRPDGEAHLEVNRPPRHRPVRTPLVTARPTAPADRERRRFPLVAILLPLVGGLALVAITRSPAYLLFVLLSPLMALGTFVSDRTGGKRSARAMRAAYDEECGRVDAAVARAVADEATERHEAHPGPATLLLTATGPRPRLWERRRDDDDVLELRLGLGAVPSQVQVRGPAGPGGADVVERPVMTCVPVTVSLAEAGVLGLAGPRARVLPLARSLVAQLAGWHSPRHLSLVVLAPDSARDWEWVRWLPHLRPGDPDAPLLVAATAGALRARVDELVALLDARAEAVSGFGRTWTGATTVAVLDGAAGLRRQPGVARLLEDGPSVGLRVLCVERELVSLPVECRATAEVTGAVGTRLRVVAPDATAYDDVVADGVSDRWTHRFARALAPLRDATPDEQDAGRTRRFRRR
jgi:S-DNA-T family DNA segregation ATPase FtsK/SpoIIIE